MECLNKNFGVLSAFPRGAFNSSKQKDKLISANSLNLNGQLDLIKKIILPENMGKQHSKFKIY